METCFRKAKNDEWVIKYIAIKNREIIQEIGPMLIKQTILSPVLVARE